MENRTLTEEEISEFKEVFNLVANDKKKTISAAELRNLIDTLGLSKNTAITESQIELMISQVDLDNNNEISFEEFLKAMTCESTNSYSKAQVTEAFETLKDADGFLSIETLENCLTSSDKKLSKDQAHEIITSQLDTTNRLNVKYEQYINSVFN